MSDISNPNLLNREFILITLIGFIYFFIFHSFLLLPIRLVQIGATEQIVGFIMGIAGLSTLFLTPSVGILADKYGKKIFISSGILLLSLSTIPLIYLDEINVIYYLLRIVHGISFSLFFIAAGALTADVSSEDRKTQAIGIYGVFTIINYALAPYIGSFLINSYGFDLFIITLFIVGLIGFLISLFIGKGQFAHKSNGFNKSYTYLECFKNENVLVASLTLFISGSAFITVLNFISIYSLSINIKNFYIFFIAYTLSVLFIRLFLGWMPDKYGKWVVTLPSLFVFATSIVILGFVSNINLLIICGIMFGIGHGFAYPSLYSIIIESNPPKARAKSFAISSLAFTTGGMLGSFVFGIIANNFGFRFMFVIIAITVFINFLIFSVKKEKIRN